MPTAALIQAPPLVPANRVGRMLATVPVLAADPKAGFGVIYERDVQVNGSAVWGNPCDTPGAAKEATEISGEVTGLPFTIFQVSKCRMLNEFAQASDNLRALFERGEERTLEEAFAAALIGGDFGTVVAAPAPLDDGARGVFAAAEQYIRTVGNLAGSIVWASAEVAMHAISRDVVYRDGDLLFTELGTPVVVLPELDEEVYVTGPTTVWRSMLMVGDPVQVVPYANEFNVLAERVFTIAVETDGDGDVRKWTVDLAV